MQDHPLLQAEILKNYISVYGMSDSYGLINITAFNNINNEELIKQGYMLQTTIFEEYLKEEYCKRLKQLGSE